MGSTNVTSSNRLGGHVILLQLESRKHVSSIHLRHVIYICASGLVGQVPESKVPVKTLQQSPRLPTHIWMLLQDSRVLLKHLRCINRDKNCGETRSAEPQERITNAHTCALLCLWRGSVNLLRSPAR